MSLETLAAYIGQIVGEVKYIDPDITTPDFYADCDGQVISDADSSYNGKRVYNINRADVELTLTWTADAGGAYATADTDDIKAISIGDWVTGSGIAADAMVKNVVDATGVITITDTAASGSITSTFTNDGLYIGGGTEGSAWDQMQRITGHAEARQLIQNNTTGDSFTGALKRGISSSIIESSGGTSSYTNIALDFDSSLSPNARTSATTAGRTKPHTRFLKAIIRIK